MAAVEEREGREAEVMCTFSSNERQPMRLVVSPQRHHVEGLDIGTIKWIILKTKM